MSWDDLRYILAVARHGTLNEGAKALQVNATTLSRRLRSMEQRAGTALFDKLKHGAVLTAAGEEMVAVAEIVEQLTNDLDARIGGLDAKLEGTIRMTSTDALLSHWMADFGELRQRYPHIDLELISGLSVVNLTQREADVAVRIAKQAPEHLLGRKHAEYMFAIYGSAELLAAQGDDKPYGDYAWMGWDLAVGRATDDWLAANAPKVRIGMRVGKMPIMVDALEAGLGITILPCVVGDANPKLRRVGDYLEGGLYVWLLTHPQLRGSARIRAFIAFVRDLIKRDQDLIEGRRPIGTCV